MAPHASHSPALSSGSPIIDIRSDGGLTPLTEQIHSGLKQNGEKRLPTMLLYSEEGLKLFEKITYLEEYYLTGQEIEVLEKNADRIAERVASKPDTMIVELGSGNLRKVKILLDAIDRRGTPVDYYALDLSQKELERTLAEVPEGTFKHVRCHGLLGTYDDGHAWLKQPKNVNRPKTILSLGSSIGNFNREEAPQFLSQFSSILKPGDNFLLGLDACTDPDKVYLAYNDRQGLTHDFVLAGLTEANKLLGHEAFHLPDWKVIGEYDVQAGRHHAFVTPTKDVTVEGVAIQANEKIRIEESYKYTWDQRRDLWTRAGVVEGAKWTNAGGDYALHLLSRPKVAYPMRPEEYAAQPVPSVADWEDLWAAWDTVTRAMIPQDELLSKPIKLRNACIFYLGHIPAFLDIHLTRATGSKATDPSFYHTVFERGIDPDVEDPEKCHAHSEIPDEWPPANEILDYQTQVRMRTIKLYESGHVQSSPKVARGLWLGYEHEMMHLETLLYMLVQSEKTLPPPDSITPDFEAMAKHAKQQAVPNEWFDIPEQDISTGMDDPENDEGPQRYFGWDVEKPERKVHVKALSIKARPITNGEYAVYMEATGKTTVPASWTETAHENGVNGVTNGHANGHPTEPSSHFLAGKAVRTVYGAVPLKFALDWPVSASYDELNGCAAYMGGRIPTADEARSVYSYAEEMKSLKAEQAKSQNIPAVNSHLVNNGVQESPPSNPSVNGGGGSGSKTAPPPPSPSSLFINLESANIGFKHWHPVPVTQNGNVLGGLSDMGGLWEWTSSPLVEHEGYAPMPLYPAYSSDFLDGKHNVVLGGSWATHPRLAGRKSFVNWYQRNYPYVWAGARLVKDN